MILFTLKVASSEGIAKLVILSVALQVVRKGLTIELRILDILDLANNFVMVDFSYVPKTSNMAAHKLAKRGSLFWGRLFGRTVSQIGLRD